VPLARHIVVHIDMELHKGRWMWPKINVEGARTEGDFLKVTGAYAALGEQLLQLAEQRRSHWQRARQGQLPVGSPHEDPADEFGVVQLTLREDFLTLPQTGL
jgi:hypothetical protein